MKRIDEKIDNYLGESYKIQSIRKDIDKILTQYIPEKVKNKLDMLIDDLEERAYEDGAKGQEYN